MAKKIEVESELGMREEISHDTSPSKLTPYKSYRKRNPVPPRVVGAPIPYAPREPDGVRTKIVEINESLSDLGGRIEGLYEKTEGIRKDPTTKTEFDDDLNFEEADPSHSAIWMALNEVDMRINEFSRRIARLTALIDD